MKQVFHKIRKVLETISKILSVVINTLLLTVVYFLGIGLTSLLAQIAKKHFLETDLKRDVSSYWIPLSSGDRPREKFYRQF